MELRCMKCDGVLRHYVVEDGRSYAIEGCGKCATLAVNKWKAIAEEMQGSRSKCCGKMDDDCDVCLVLDCWSTEILEQVEKG